jgi:plastocyanin
MAEVGCLRDGNFQNLQVEGTLFNTNSTGIAANSALILNGAPLSGTTSGSFIGVADPNAQCYDKINNVTYINEGTKASPYWSPTNIRDIGLRGVSAQLIGGEGGKSIADTTASAIIGYNTRVYGQGIAETDSGVVSSGGEGFSQTELRTTNEDVHTVALSMGGSGTTLQPDTHGPIVIDIDYTNDAITHRSIFLGFQNLSIDALIEPCIGATTTITFNNVSATCDDIAGLFLDTSLTVGNKYFLAHTSSDAAATFATSASVGGAAAGVGQVAAAGTFQRLRIQVGAGGSVTAFINKAEVGHVVSALDADEEIVPVFCLGAAEAGIKQVEVKEFTVFASKSLT